MNCQKQWLHSTISLPVPKGQESSAAKIKLYFFVKSREMADLAKKFRGMDMDSLTVKKATSQLKASVLGQICFQLELGKGKYLSRQVLEIPMLVRVRSRCLGESHCHQR